MHGAGQVVRAVRGRQRDAGGLLEADVQAGGAGGTRGDGESGGGEEVLDGVHGRFSLFGGSRAQRAARLPRRPAKPRAARAPNTSAADCGSGTSVTAFRDAV